MDKFTFYRFVFWAGFTGIILFMLDFGLVKNPNLQPVLNSFYIAVLFSGAAAAIVRFKNVISEQAASEMPLWLVRGFFTGLVVLALFPLIHPVTLPLWLKLLVLPIFLREFLAIRFQKRRTFLNPAQLFIASFIAMILIGAALLMLPNATYQQITFTDALFTSTSAVCVTGLITVDTATYFTIFGQSIILLLIQIGGLGILTFASYFSYFFKGGTSYENQFALSDITSSQKLGDVFSTLKYILLITFSIEFFSAILLFTTLDPQLFNSLFDRIYFSIFHAISAFCNAGFSTLTLGLYDNSLRFNYFFQLIIVGTFVLGGLGFPIVVNILSFLKYWALNVLNVRFKRANYIPWVLNLNSRITLITTVSLTVIGFILFLILEYNNVLASHHGFGKLVAALFGASTPRTAGFNTFDFAELHFPTLMLIFLLMWIGASPSSTGGGIKTSTFAIATLNILSLAKGKTRIEIFRREIADISVRRAFAIICLSLIVIGFGIMLISAFETNADLMSVAFECFSAYSTVGLSLGLTAKLSAASKYVLVLIMFIGRVSMLSLAIAVFTKVKHKNYRYPTEEITIN